MIAKLILALVRWPPMGRRKHMLDGQLRGRNELVADAIEKETSIPRTRKQVSSHIQVLKNKCQDVPGSMK
jgi:transcriptional enhancer factor